MTAGMALQGAAALAYLAAAVGFQWELFRGRSAWGRWRALLVLSAALHGLGLAFLGALRGHFPVTGLVEATSTLAWVVVLGYLAVGVRWNVEVVGAVVAPAAFAMTVFSMAAGSWKATARDLGPWVTVHVASVVVGYGAFCLAAFCALLYLLQARMLKQKKLTGLFRRIPPLATLDQVSYRLILVGFLPMVLGIASGMLILKSHHGVYWSWDPKQLLVTLTGLVYVAYLYARLVAGWQGRRVNILLLVAFGCVLVSFLAPGSVHRL